MTNYKKLIETLRWTANEYKGSIMDEEDKETMNDAAAAIEELLKENKELIEDHCILDSIHTDCEREVQE